MREWVGEGRERERAGGEWERGGEGEEGREGKREAGRGKGKRRGGRGGERKEGVLRFARIRCQTLTSYNSVDL